MDRQTEKNTGTSSGDKNRGAIPRDNNADAARHTIPPREVPPSQEDLQRQYDLVSKSLDYLGLVLAAMLLNYYTVDIQKQQLSASLSGTQDPFAELDLFPFQMSSAVMLLSSTSFFFGVSQDALEQPQTDPVIQESLQLNNYINASVLIAAVVRIYNLLLVKYGPQPLEETPEETLEESDVELEDSLI